jgi:hypothetical protein
MIESVSQGLILGAMLFGVFVLCHVLNALAESIYWWWQDRKHDDDV